MEEPPINLADPAFAHAVAVSDFLLEVTRRAYVARDFDAFADRFLLPQVVGTFHGDRLLETRAELRSTFDNMCNLFDRAGIIDLDRRTLSGHYRGPDEIHATFVTRHILHGYAFGEEIVGHGTLRQVDGRWHVAETRYATNYEAVNEIIVPGGHRVAPR